MKVVGALPRTAQTHEQAEKTLDVLITVASTRASLGGTSRSVTGLCSALWANGVDVRLVAGGRTDVEMILPDSPVNTVRVSERRLGLTFPIAFYRTLKRELWTKRPDVVHDNGVWLPSNWAAAELARRAGVPLVLSTRGMLTAWALRFHRRRKMVAWNAYQRRLLQHVSAFDATSDEEASDLRSLGLRQPIAVIPNGVMIPTQPASSRPATNQRRALFMSRLHPKKGIPLLLLAWSQVRPANWILEIAGPDEGGHRAEMQRLAGECGLAEQVRFIGDFSDSEKWATYASADLFILPSHSENFGLAIAEALASRVPVITTTGTPWSVLAAANCGWWVLPDLASLTAALRDATSRPREDLRTMGERGRTLVEERFSWERVAGDTLKLYQWLSNQGPQPSFVRSD